MASATQSDSSIPVDDDKTDVESLPDEILVNILSRMPIYHACKTGSLSRRWKHMWTQVSNIMFFDDYDDIVDNVGPENGFFSFVDNVLDRCDDTNKIKRFWIQFKHHDRKDARRIQRWFQFAVDRHAEDIVLMQHDGSWPIILPEILVSCSSMTKLKLKGFVINENDKINWPFLKSLSLRCMKLNNETVEKLLAGCPALETVEFSHYGFFRELRISSQKLTKLILETCFPLEFDYSDPWLNIYAPYLQHLEIYGEVQCRLVNVSSLVNATFYCEMNLHLIQDFVSSASQAKQLSFDRWIAEALSTLEFNKLSAIEFSCKKLVLNCHITRHNIDGVTRFLHVLPYLDTLEIHLDYMSLFFGEHSICKASKACDDWNNNNVRLNNLKEVKICHEYGCSKVHIELSEFAKFVVSKATNLERIVLMWRKGWYCTKCSINCASQFFSNLAIQLHHSPLKSSPSPLILLSESN